MTLILNSEVPRDHLVVPDEHYYPGDNFRRCEALGNYIADKRPPVIVRLGDIWDMASLCSWDKGKKELVFKNVRDDIESGHEADKHIWGPLLKLNKELARKKEKQYHPIIVKLIGNHEYRVQKLLDYEPKWEGSVSMDAFNTRQPIKEIVVPFLDFIQIDGVNYSHYFQSGVKGNPFSSTRSMLAKTGSSCTMGHVHTLEHSVLTKPTGERIRGLFAGCFHDPDHASFAGPQVDKIWWNGIIYKHGVHNGSYDLEEVSVQKLIREYT